MSSSTLHCQWHGVRRCRRAWGFSTSTFRHERLCVTTDQTPVALLGYVPILAGESYLHKISFSLDFATCSFGLLPLSQFHLNGKGFRG